ncbi:MAG TPA: hypothetical protein DCO79_01110 [Spirochaeta sp.]|nr:hypothetical protein [Spirochaeta sp.]
MLLYEELSNKIVGAFFSVHNELKMGLLESCYHNVLFFELKSIGLNVVYNASLNVFYKGELQALMLIHERACIYTSMYIGW